MTSPATSDRNVIVMWHRPYTSSGASGGNSALAPLWAIFYDYGVDLVLAGHDHHYEVFDRLSRTGTAVDATNGVRELIVGTGGVSRDRLDRRPSRAASSANSTPSACSS